MEPKKAILVIGAKVNKPAVRKAIVQAAKMGQRCMHFDITGYVVFYSGGVKEIRQQVRKLRAENRIPFDYLLIYAPREIAKTETEFNTFCWQMEKECQCIVKWPKWD